MTTEYSNPAVVSVADDMTGIDPVLENARAHPQAVSFTRQVDGRWVDVTAEEFAEDVLAIAKGIAAKGLEPGDRVGLMSGTTYEWTLCDYAIWAAGCVTVPVYETSSAEQIEWYMGNSGAKVCFAQTADHAAEIREAVPEVDHLTDVWAWPDGALDMLREAGKGMSDEDLHARRSGLSADDLATIIYTSGTTGRPKGVELSHRNLLFDAMTTSEGLSEHFNDQSSTLLFLPLAHSFGRLIQVGCVLNRVRLAHTSDIKNLQPLLQEIKPTFLLSVPRVFEKVYNGAKQRAHADGKGRIFDQAEKVAIEYSKRQDGNGSGGPLGPLQGVATTAQHKVFDKLVYSKLREALGGEITGCISGGAPLGERLGHFYRGIGVPVYEGYGLTETSAGATLNLTDTAKIGTVGQPIPGVSVRIAEDGEVMLKGANIMQGYHDNAEATKESIDDDGWFATGDLGSLDDDGFLKIVGRKKELIVTAGGKNVSPAVLEDRLRAHRLVSQCMVVGDQQPFIGCLVTVDAEAIPSWLEQNGRDKDTPVSELTDDADLRAEIQKAVDEANKAVSKAEAIKSFRILATDFTVEDGQLTPSMKLKRPVVQKEFESEIAAIYEK